MYLILALIVLWLLFMAYLFLPLFYGALTGIWKDTHQSKLRRGLRIVGLVAIWSLALAILYTAFVLQNPIAIGVLTILFIVLVIVYGNDSSVDNLRP